MSKKVLHYCEERLRELGLTKEDLTAEVKSFGTDAYERRVERESREMLRIIPGTFDGAYNITTGPDIAFQYVGLDWGQMTYIRDGSRKERPFTRVRFANPGAHLNKYGDPMKYQTPPGGGVFPWIPNKVIQDYHNNRKYDVLVITEGEFKAEKLTKAGVNSIGIGGITMFAGKGQTLGKEYEMIIRQAGIKRVLFLMDSDLFELSNDLAQKPGKSSNQRPWSFYTAAKKFVEYFRSFETNGLYLDLFIGWNHPGPNGEKGVDDVLAGPLRQQEYKLANEIGPLLLKPPVKTEAIPLDHAKGNYVTVVKVTEATDTQLKKLWHLDSVQSFAKAYSNQLIPLGQFNYRGEPWKIDLTGFIQMARPLTKEEEFWKTEYSADGKKENIIFYYQGLYRFLLNRDFGRWMTANRDFIFIRVAEKVIEELEPYMIRDYVTAFTEDLLSMSDVLEMIYRGGDRYLGKNSLSNLKFCQLPVYRADRDSQNMFFMNTFWKITEKGIESRNMAELPGVIWESNQIKFKPTDNTPLFKVIKEGDGWDIESHPDTESCDFYKFIVLTSLYHWKEKERKAGEDPEWDFSETQNTEHINGIASKITAIGYLLHQYFDPARTKAIIAMDATMGEVGASRGRSGKSLIAVALEKVLKVHFINGKKQRLTQDPFWLDGVDDRTDVLWIDDVLKSFNFEDIFPHITGRFTVNPKGATQFQIAPELTPKFYIPTNHAIAGQGGSFEDRQMIIGFSDFFNKDRKPEDVFEARFFDDWDHAQWQIFYRFMATCLMTYFQHGLIESPTTSLINRKLRQAMGEDFYQWAEDYFSPEGGAINQRMDKKAMQATFESEFPRMKAFMNVRKFKDNIKMYGQMNGLHFNPNRPDKEGKRFDPASGTLHVGTDDKSNSTEYFTLADNNWTSAHSGMLDIIS